MNENSQKIGLLGAISIGIGGMVGGGIFAVLGEAVSLAHGATFVAFFVAGLIALLTAYSYAKLSVTYQKRGGTVVFINKAFEHKLLSGSANVLLWLSYLVTIALYASAFSSYAQTFFSGYEGKILAHILVSVAIILPALINLISSTFVSKSESIIVAIKVILLFVIIASGLFFVDTTRLSVSEWESPIAIVSAGMIIFVAYEGFELIANAAEEIKEPKKNLPRAFYSSVLFVILLYILISIVTVGAVDETQLLKAKDYALALAAEPALGQFGFTIVAIAALLSTFSAINATVYGNARLGYSLAKEGELPVLLSEEKRDIPQEGIYVTTLLSLIIANTIELTEIAIIASAGFLLIFTIVNISAFKLRDKIQASAPLLLVAIAASLSALALLLQHTYLSNPRAIIVFIAFILFALGFELLYGKLIRQKFSPEK